MKKKFISLLLALVMCLGLMPVGVSAAQTDLPDWYFLFAIFKNVDANVKDGNGKFQHVNYSMPREEVDLIRDLAAEFEEYMNSVGVIRAHADVVEIDTTVTEMKNPDKGGSIFGPEQAAPFLKDKVDLDRYDHVFCILDLTVWTGYAGLTYSPPFENGTGMSHIYHQDWAHLQNTYRSYTDRNLWHVGTYVHEFLHFGEQLTRKWGADFNLHNITDHFYPSEDQRQTCRTDIILNRAKGTAGTGVHPLVWQYPPHVMRTMTELTIPSGVTGIGEFAFASNKTLTRVFIPSSVTSIGGAAFQACSSLTSVSIPASITRVEDYTFVNCDLTDVYYSGSEAQWKAIPIGISNGSLHKANIHYNHLMADVKTSDWFAQPVIWAVEKGITAGTGNGGFSPSATCTQGQILTFLWRAKGSPEPKGAAKGNEYYAVPLQWATEQGLVDGNLSAKAPCTRADVVTYLWKLAGCPKAGASSFTDVPANAAYAPAVSWAVEQGVTGGTSATTFSPGSTCTRGQIVTFLYKALG